jgi:flagellar basal body-associated protein FliL
LAQGTEKIKTLWQGEHQRKLMIGGGVVLALILGFVAWEVRSVYHSVGKVVLSPALYREMSRPLVVRFDEKGMFSLIRVKLAFLTRDAGIVDYLSTHETELKESCVEVLAKEKSDHLLTRTGKEALLGHLLEAANQVVHQDSSINATQKVEAVLLQEFVMQ